MRVISDLAIVAVSASCFLVICASAPFGVVLFPLAIAWNRMATLPKRELVAAFVTSLVVGAMIVACVGPATNPDPKAWPCGYHGHGCGNGYCCDDLEICGTANEGVDGAAYSGCAEGYCCYSGSDTYSVSVSLPKRQYRETP
jgi:hypothetical protein